MRDRLVTGALAAVVVLLGWYALQARCALQELDDVRQRADSLGAEILVTEARAQGLEAKFGRRVENLQDSLIADDSVIAGLQEELGAARAHVLSLTQVLASAEGELESRADPDTATSPTRFSGEWTDSILSLRWSFHVKRRVLEADYSVSIPGEIVHTITGDRRVLVLARSTHPDATLQVPAVEVELPPPPEAADPSPLYLVGAGLVGYGLGKGIEELLRALPF